MDKFSKSNKADDEIDIFEKIKTSKKMEYSWYSIKDFIKHKGIVILFDGFQTFSLDYGPDKSDFKNKLRALTVTTAAKLASSIPSKSERTKKKVASMKLAGMVNLNLYCGIDVEIMGTLLTLSIGTKEEKENAMNMFIVISKINIGEWQLLEKNCRDYVIAVYQYLSEYPEMKEEDQEKFEKAMENLKTEDKQTFKSVKRFEANFFNKTVRYVLEEAATLGAREALL